MSAKPTTAAAPRRESWVKTGAGALAALERAEQEAKERAERGFMPFRLWLPKGEEVEVIILDDFYVSDEPGVGGALVKEHNLKGADGKWGTFESCCSDFAPCALCDKAGTEGFGIATPAVMLTVLVLKDWTSKKSGEVHKYSRMLMPVKLSQKDLFLQLQAHGVREQGSMRGMYLVMRRGTGDQSVSTGEPAMLDNGKLYDFVSEDEMLAEYGHPAVKNREGKIIKPANADLEPFDYDELFPRPDPDDLAKRFGGRALAGSRRAAAQDWDNEQAAGDAAADAAQAPVTRRRAAAAPPVSNAATPPPQAPVSRRRGGAASAPETTPPAAASPPAGNGPVRRRGAPPASAPGAGSAAW